MLNCKNTCQLEKKWKRDYYIALSYFLKLLYIYLIWINGRHWIFFLKFAVAVAKGTRNSVNRRDFHENVDILPRDLTENTMKILIQLIDLRCSFHENSEEATLIYYAVFYVEKG